MEKFADSHQQEAWRAYACAALQGCVGPYIDTKEVPACMRMAARVADAMMAEEMKRARA